ncbi:hypothetical protein BDZ97DRAFT_1844123 [Flammula alnicola]|nr:hypothetical protein BDZ97DRAFT_1844123 [Flammula alnicola]
MLGLYIRLPQLHHRNLATTPGSDDLAMQASAYQPERYSDGSGPELDSSSAVISKTPVGLQSQISQIFWTAIKYFVVGLDYLIGFVKHCVNSLSLSAEENTSISFCLLVLVGIALNIIGTPFERPSSTPTTQDKQLTKGQELLGEDWKVHEEIRAQVEREREAWKQEQKDMEKRREEDRLREKERQVMAVERKKWEREKKKRDNVKKRFEADKKKNEEKWKKEQEKTRKWKDEIERERKVTVKNLPD